MNAKEIKQAAKEFGADLVGIAPVARLDHLPPQSHPRTLSADARSVIVVGHRLLRGALRGVEEGTNFHSTYGSFGLNWNVDQFLSRTVYQLTCLLEREGMEAIPMPTFRRPDETFVPDFAAVAEVAGLGSVGKGGFFLTPRHGHRQRLAMIVVDADLEANAPIKIDLCDGCAACRDGCPLGALTDAPGDDGRFALNLDLCRTCENGAFSTPDRTEPVDRLAAACGRACLVAVENKIGERFAQKFRKRKVWSRVPAFEAPEVK